MPTKTVTKESFSDAELAKLSKLAGSRARVAKNLQLYHRHTTRIRALERVLDPNDKHAIGNPVSGNPDSYRAEIARREADLEKVSAYLRGVLSASK